MLEAIESKSHEELPTTKLLMGKFSILYMNILQLYKVDWTHSMFDDYRVIHLVNIQSNVTSHLVGFERI